MFGVSDFSRPKSDVLFIYTCVCVYVDKAVNAAWR